jgi:4-hydroxy-tetrahydrodipicolinate reductase
MRIALIGYGKMGKEIEILAREKGHQIVCIVDSQNPIENADFSTIDAAIEFTKPELAIPHINFCLENKIPLVVGTTGWSEHLQSITEKVKLSNGSLLHASNFSIGVNIFFEINRKLAELMSPYSSDYQLSMEETHHTQKLDAPSGTAISLANDIITKSTYEKWNCVKDNDAVPKSKLPNFDIVAKRIPEVPGTHVIKYSSDIEVIEIKHEAKNRKGFALGAIYAAEWLQGKQGIFTMKNALNI